MARGASVLVLVGFNRGNSISCFDVRKYKVVSIFCSGPRQQVGGGRLRGHFDLDLDLLCDEIMKPKPTSAI